MSIRERIPTHTEDIDSAIYIGPRHGGIVPGVISEPLAHPISVDNNGRAGYVLG